MFCLTVHRLLLVLSFSGLCAARHLSVVTIHTPPRPPMSLRDETHFRGNLSPALLELLKNTDNLKLTLGEVLCLCHDVHTLEDLATMDVLNLSWMLETLARLSELLHMRHSRLAGAFGTLLEAVGAAYQPSAALAPTAGHDNKSGSGVTAAGLSSLPADEPSNWSLMHPDPDTTTALSQCLADRLGEVLKTPTTGIDQQLINDTLQHLWDSQRLAAESVAEAVLAHNLIDAVPMPGRGTAELTVVKGAKLVLRDLILWRVIGHLLGAEDSAVEKSLKLSCLTGEPRAQLKNGMVKIKEAMADIRLAIATAVKRPRHRGSTPGVPDVGSDEKTPQPSAEAGSARACSAIDDPQPSTMAGCAVDF